MQIQDFNKIRKKIEIVAISDTHGNYKHLNKILKMKGDIFIHCGDFTFHGKQQDFFKFYQYLDKLKFKHKIVIAGNHQIMLDNGCISKYHKQKYLIKYPCSLSKDKIIYQLKKKCIYLEHQAIECQGIKFFGSPYTPYYCGSAFQYQNSHEKVIWNHIPKQIDILITHGPPLGILDKNYDGKLGGSAYLKEISINRKPKYHIFGHIHESTGMQKSNGILFLNVAQQQTRVLF